MARCRGTCRSPLNPELREPCPYDALWGVFCYFHGKVHERLVRDYFHGRERIVLPGASEPTDPEARDLLEQLMEEWA